VQAGKNPQSSVIEGWGFFLDPSPRPKSIKTHGMGRGGAL